MAFTILTGCNGEIEPVPEEPIVNKVTITEDGEEWRLFDEEGNNQGIWNVVEGQDITWEVTGSDVIFSFPRDMRTYFRFDQDIFVEIDTLYSGPDGNEPRLVHKVAEGDSLSFFVRELEESQQNESEQEMQEENEDITIDYDIYVMEAEKYVVGNSPPYLIIRRSSN